MQVVGNYLLDLSLHGFEVPTWFDCGYRFGIISTEARAADGHHLWRAFAPLECQGSLLVVREAHSDGVAGCFLVLEGEHRRLFDTLGARRGLDVLHCEYAGLNVGPTSVEECLVVGIKHHLCSDTARSAHEARSLAVKDGDFQAPVCKFQGRQRAGDPATYDSHLFGLTLGRVHLEGATSLACAAPKWTHTTPCRARCPAPIPALARVARAPGVCLASAIILPRLASRPCQEVGGPTSPKCANNQNATPNNDACATRTLFGKGLPTIGRRAIEGRCGLDVMQHCRAALTTNNLDNLSCWRP
mmetsp:Transcript_91513/g.262057  ORF Transcript_91513/g.262057 Transcript_91513/m.262057 type:complete len:301 (-) Transcript_91513:3-905(-)